jgi:hypothetical protein
VHITALNVIHPITKATDLEQQRKFIEAEKSRMRQGEINPFDPNFDKVINSQRIRKIRKATTTRAKYADRIRISSAERFKTKKRFDVILDVFGPLFHSAFPEEVMQSYIEALEENGEIITPMKIMFGPDKIDKTYTDSKTGQIYKIEITPLIGGEAVFWSIKKVPVKE